MHLISLAKCYCKKTIYWLLSLLVVTSIILGAAIIYYFPMGAIILRPTGDVGEQLFQYAAAYSLSQSLQRNLVIMPLPKTAEPRDKIPNIDLSPYLKLPNQKDTQSNKLIEFVLAKNHPPFIRQILSFFVQDVTHRKFIYGQDIFMHGTSALLLTDRFFSDIFFYKHAKDFAKILTPLQNINPNNAELAANLSQANAVCSYSTLGNEYAEYMTPIRYQKKAMQLAAKLIANPQFYIFTYDVNKARNGFGVEQNIHYVPLSNPPSVAEFALLSKCTNFIVDHSGLAWWPAYLNTKQNALTIAPYPHVGDDFLNNIEENPERYVTKALAYGAAPKLDWILLDYDRKPLTEIAHSILPEAKYKTLLANYKALPFYMYSGDLQQLTLCQNGNEMRSGICFLNDPSAKPTVVTTYYKIPSKYSFEQYTRWAKNFLNIPFNLVVFTDKENAEWIKAQRGKLPLVIIEKEFNELNYYKLYDQYKTFSKMASHSFFTPELYILWLEKVKFIQQAIDLNHYNADYFVWCDLGAVRQTRYMHLDFPNIKYLLRDQMTYVALYDFNLREMARKLPDPYIRIAGNIQIGDKTSWRIYNELWDQTMTEMLQYGNSAAVDESILAQGSLRHPELFNRVFLDGKFRGHPWHYALRRYAQGPNMQILP